jgi:exodeoxyribonuclease VII large subunit
MQELNAIEELYNELYLSIQKIKTKKITGEIISNKHSGNHSYITIKNDEYQLGCIGWCKNLFDIKQGSNVEITGCISIMKKNLSTYFNIKDIKVLGNGDYLNSHTELRKKISDLGWNNNKKKLITFPTNIGIVTSLEGAAIQDILQTFKLDCYFGNIFIKNAIVQGKQCPDSVINGIEYFANSLLNIDLLLVTRGGGSYDDLVGFSDWNLITKIHESKFITISAVGHQTDNQLSDEVSDYKFATPSIAAKFIVETQKKYLQMLDQFKNCLTDHTDKINISKNKYISISKKYNLIIGEFDNKQLNEDIIKYKNFINGMALKWTNTKTNFYNQLSNIKPTIIKNNKEITSINNIIQDNPKKLDIVFPDGTIQIYYQVKQYTTIK